ncbi:leucine Rich Repeat [Bacteroides sp. 51]|uniref:leucine Rich Repeat n=1 Tax=Bacteroides sp. 51 TaxID=2302938 RepID=UPI0013CFEB0D|nr:leucine Rich Repeat [Bacteroides sp. 51]NDV80718.1 leucine Rich Repeat [Bacteroides sp. 51]
MNKRMLYGLLGLILVFTATSCSTNDVDWPEGSDPDPDELYEITDIAFADYLIYNSELAATETNALPAGTALKKDGKYYIDKKIAATATYVYLVKNATQITKLEGAGVATAAQKIVNLDGIQHFTGALELKLTSNAIVGKLDLSALTSLENLEMNSNYANELIVPASMKRLRYGASTLEDAPDNRWLTAIDLTNCSALEHIYLKDHKITTEGLKLPASYANLKEIDLLNNPDAPFEIPVDLYAQLTMKNGVTDNADPSYTGPKPQADYFQVPDLAFAEYLVYLTEVATDDTKLPEGAAFKYTDNKIYINKAIAATATTLNISKAAAFITKLTNANVPTADAKIANADGLQFFTSITSLTATSNEFTEPLKLTTLTELTSLVVRTAGLSALDVTANTKLTDLDIQGSTKASLGRLKAANLTNNTRLVNVNLSANEIVPADFKLPTTYADMKVLNMKNNKVDGNTVTYTVPAALFNQLTTKDGLVSE